MPHVLAVVIVRRIHALSAMRGLAALGAGRAGQVVIARETAVLRRHALAALSGGVTLLGGVHRGKAPVGCGMLIAIHGFLHSSCCTKVLPGAPPWRPLALKEAYLASTGIMAEGRA